MIFNPQKQGLMEILDVIASQWMRTESKAKLWVPHSVSNDFQETQNVAIIENSLAPVEALSALVEEIRESQSHIDHLLNVVFPPLWGVRAAPPEWTETYGRREFWQVLSEHLLEEPPIETEIAFILPQHSLTGSGAAAWRKEFFEKRNFLVAEAFNSLLPGQFARLFSCSLLIVGAKKEQSRVFIDISECLSATNPLAKLRSELGCLLKSKKACKMSSGFKSAISPAEEDRFVSHLFSGDLQEKLAQIEILGAASTLSEVAKIFPGLHKSKLAVASKQDAGVVPIISAGDLVSLHRVDVSDSDILEIDKLSFARVDVSVARNLLQDGDLCLPMIGRAGAPIKVVIYRGESDRIAVGHTVIVVRLHSSLHKIQRQLIVEFLGSSFAGDVFDRYYASLLGDLRRITVQQLRELKVPIAEEDILNAIDDLVLAKQAFSAWIEDVNHAINSVFTFSEASKESRLSIMTSGKLARQRYQAASYIDDLNYRVSSLYPFPVSFLWRYSQVAAHSNYEQLRAILRAAEGHTCFIATITLLISRSLNIPIAHLREMSTRLSDKRRGTTFGDWFHIVETVLIAKEFRRFDGYLPFKEILTLSIDLEWSGALKRLMKIRHDDSHQRLNPESVSDDFLDSAKEALEQVYRSTDFLTDYKLAYITEVFTDTLSNTTRFTFKDLTGDNQLPRTSEEILARTDVERNSLYLIDGEKKWHLARPYLHYLKCPECHQMSTFYLDKLSGKDDFVVIKSFERNSSREEPFQKAFVASGLVSV